MDFFAVCLYPFACFQIVVGESSRRPLGCHVATEGAIRPESLRSMYRTITGPAGKALWRDLFIKAPKGKRAVLRHQASPKRATTLRQKDRGRQAPVSW